MTPTQAIESGAAQAVAHSVAPSDILRAAAHEIRQPLSAIESTAYYLGLVLDRDDSRSREQVTRLQHLVEQSNWILTNAVQLAAWVEPRAEPLDLEELITEAVSARGPGPAPRLDLAGNLPPVSLDPGMGRALIENLMTLFRQIGGAVTVRTSAEAEGIVVEFAGPAASAGNATRLPPGWMISVESARTVAQMHGGSVTFEVEPGSQVRLRLQLSAAR